MEISALKKLRSSLAFVHGMAEHSRIHVGGRIGDAKEGGPNPHVGLRQLVSTEANTFGTSHPG